MQVMSISFVAPTINNSQKVVLSAASAQSVVYDATNCLSNKVLLTSDVPCWIMSGVNPTAVADGTCLYLAANVMYRILLAPGFKLALIAGGAGNAYITPEN